MSDIFDRPYDRESFVSFLCGSFLTEDAGRREELKRSGLTFGHIREVTELCSAPALDCAVLEIRHESESDPRVGLSRDTFRLMSEFNIERVLAAFVSPGSDNWRLSLITIDLTLGDGKIERSYSNPRRLSYLLGPSARVRTPRQYLLKKGRVKDFEDVRSRFSVEVVNKEFYGEIARAFSCLAGGRRMVKSHEEEFAGVLKLPSKAPGDPKYKEFSVRLIGRLIFCWFLKKKISNNGRPLLPEGLLSSDAARSTGDYYHEVLEPLFFKTLNTPIDERDAEFRKGVFAEIPFLNGGLFEPHPDDYYGKPSYRNTLKVPDEWFADFFAILETYNFTIDENTTIDVDLSIDPEMLGRIFENLLAEINPETEETARKATGSYYTPRNIVDYMVTESIKQYLVTRTGIDASLVTDLLSFEMEGSSLSEDDNRKVVAALEELRIIDPACGSGAFPMGVLQKMVLVLQKVDPDSKRWLASLLSNIPDTTAREMMRRKLENEHDMWDYTRKLGIIRKSIYGVDIQPIAVEIAKLRCFLSLIVDENVIDEKDNRNIEALPNLEFKFVCANSLVDVPEEGQQDGLLVDEYFEKMEGLIRDYFQAWQPGKKKDLRARIEALVDARVKEKDTVLRNLMSAGFHSKHALPKTKKKQQEIEDVLRARSLWQSYKNIFNGEPVGFFNVRYFFPDVKDGFGVVIANPPYVRQEQIKEFKRHFQALYDCYTGTADLYVYFYERGTKLLADGGVMTYISSNKYFRSAYGEHLRNYLASKFTIHQVVDFGDAPVFNAIAYPSIIILQKKDPEGSTVKTLNWVPGENIDSFASVFAERCRPMEQKELSGAGWKLESPAVLRLMEKLRKAGTPLGEYVKGRLYYGIKTGLNEAFVVDRATRDRLIAEHSSSAEVLKPFLRGRDVKRWRVEYQDLWLIFTRRGIDIKKYPAIEKHLKQYKKQLMPGVPGGRKPGSYEWYEIQDNIAYWEEFERLKIVWGNLAQKPKFSFSEKGMYINAPSCLLMSQDKYLLGILNSNITKYIVTQSAATRQGGFLEFKPMYIEKVPIPEKDRERRIEEYVNSILSKLQDNPDEDVIELEHKINEQVYRLYGLTEEEIRIVEGAE